MPSASADNVLGHRAKYNALIAGLSPEEAANEFVGGGDPIEHGYIQLELIRRYKDPAGSSIVDIGCGIGRLTMHMRHEAVDSYLGIDIIPEIMQGAIDRAKGDDRFSFAVGEECRIPKADASADIVTAFSVITHLLDEECFEYLLEARRVLRTGGVALFSFLNFESPDLRKIFFAHARRHRSGHGDLLKFTTPGVLRYFAEEVGFSSVEFIEGSQQIPTSGKTSPLIGPERVRKTVAPGQALCVMKV